MKKSLAVILVGTAGATIALSAYASGTTRLLASRAPSAADSIVVGVFEGRTPCGPIAAEFTGFPAQNCEKIKWQLTLYRDASTKRPTAFLYEGTRTTRRGTWTIQRGTASDPSAQVYRLKPDLSGKVLSLLSVDENVLLLLDTELRVLIGDASWSYVLNRTDRKSSGP